jgi:hypothetical protein
MKRVIEQLEGARKIIIGVGLDLEYRLTKEEAFELNLGVEQISKAIVELKAPLRWETPEQWKKRTGKEWPNHAAVFTRLSGAVTPWDLGLYRAYKVAISIIEQSGEGVAPFDVICATEAGCPPDDWRPFVEEEEKTNGR